jgi:hypothetical protein
MPKPMLRVAFAVATPLLLWAVLAGMARLSWQVDGLIAAAACVAFAFYFERDEGDPQ